MILERILEAKREEVSRRCRDTGIDGLRAAGLYAEPRRGFKDAIEGKKARCIIAEIKKASPSKGLIREDFNPAAHAAEYEKAGATCISILTDEEFFSGSLADLSAVRGASRLPLLRKDFTIDPYQIVEARAAGADAVLLIVAAVERSLLAELAACALAEGLDVLAEVHDGDELEVALEEGMQLIGVNNRDLKTFTTSTDVTRSLLPLMPEAVTVVSESGLGDPKELAELETLGVDAFLIGEAFMRAPRPGQALSELL